MSEKFVPKTSLYNLKEGDDFIHDENRLTVSCVFNETGMVEAEDCYGRNTQKFPRTTLVVRV